MADAFGQTAEPGAAVRIARSVLLAMAVLYAGACAPSEGPLRVLALSGASILPAAESPESVATFGDSPICVEDGEEATILSIEYSGNFPPGSVRPAIQDADLDGLSTDQWAGIEMLRISPRELLARDDFVGTIEEEVAGYTVTTACDDASQDAHLTGVLTVVDAGDEGADISHYTIRYEAGGREHEVSSSWQYVACGTRTQDVEGC